MRLIACLVVMAVPLAAAERALSLRDAVRLACESSPDLAIERANRGSAEAAVLSAQGTFDPVLRAVGALRRATIPTGSALESPTGRLDERQHTQSLAFVQRLPWQGTRFEASFENSRSATNNPFFALNPYWVPRATATLTVPLARGRRTDAERTALLVRRGEATVVASESETRLAELIGRVEAAYWDLAGAREMLAAAALPLELARQADDATSRLIAQGELPEAERSGSTAEVARRLEAVAATQGRVHQAENALKQLLAATVDDPLWADSLALVDAQAPVASEDIGEAVRTALARRPELRTLHERANVQAAEQEAAMDSQKPQVDLTLTYVAQGLAGRAVPQLDPTFPVAVGVPRQLTGSFGRAFSQLTQGNYPTFQAGLTIDWPLRNRAAQGRMRQVAWEAERLRQERRRTELAIVAEVRQALAALAAGRTQLRAAEEAAEASSARLASEWRLFVQGETTNLALNTRRNEMAEARERTAILRRAINLAAAELRRATAAGPAEFQVQREALPHRLAK